MLGTLSSLALILVWLLAPTSAMEGCAPGDVAEQVNTAKKPLEGVALFTATIPQTSPETERVSLSLQLTNLGKELLVFNDRPMETFSVKVKKKDGALPPTTRYFKALVEESKRRDRNVLIGQVHGEASRWKDRHRELTFHDSCCAFCSDNEAEVRGPRSLPQ